jgi:hypothetical protein
MEQKRLLFICWIISFGLSASAQKISYSSYDKDDSRRLDFEIVGKIGGNFLIYKNIRNHHWITILDNEMKQISKVDQSYVPDNDRMINVDFFPYADFCYMIYQYQKKNLVYCMASKIDANGNKIGEVIQLDTTQISFASNNKIYTVLSSEDKSKLIVFKINSKNKELFLMTTILINNKLEVLKKTRMAIPMQERDDNLGDFQLDNEGDLVFCKFSRNNIDNINKVNFVIKYAQSDTLQTTNLNIAKTWLDDIRIKVDNYNRKYFLTSFYYKERKGNIEGLYFFVWDKASNKASMESSSVFSEELRKEAKGNSPGKMAFNDYFLKTIITRKDGGFLICSEAYYTTSRFNNWNRMDYLYGYGSSMYNNYYYSPYSNSWYGSRLGNNQALRYHADNIAVLSFNPAGKIEWEKVISKSQFDDESDDHISYQVMNTGGQLHFLFNQLEKRNSLLSDYSLAPTGEITRSPTLKNLDKGYEFMPKHAKQVSARQMIVPCIYRNFVCFAKIDFN